MKTFLLRTTEKYPEVFVTFLTEIGLKECSDGKKPDYIIFDKEELCLALSQEFETVKNQIKFISLEKIKHIEKFLALNGALVVDESKLADSCYIRVLKNFFLESISLHLEDNLVNLFNEFHQFDLTSYMTMGQMTDELMAYVINKDFDPIAPRMFINSIVYYISYLKQAGQALVPYEFEAGISDEKFGIQVSVPVKNFSAKYIHQSFTEIDSGKPLKGLLSIALNQSDYMNISYLENQSKLVILGVWDKGVQEKRSLLSLQNINTPEQISVDVEEKIYAYKNVDVSAQNYQEKTLPGSFAETLEKESQTIVDLGLEDFVDICHERFATGDISLKKLEQLVEEIEKNYLENPLKQDEKETVIKVLESHFKDRDMIDEVQHIREKISSNEGEKRIFQKILDDEIVKRVSAFLENNDIHFVKGQKDANDNFVKRLKGEKKLDDFILHLSGKISEKNTVFDFDKLQLDKKKQAARGVWKNILKETTEKYLFSPHEREVFEQKSLEILSHKFNEYLNEKSELTQENFEDFNRNIAKKVLIKSIEEISLKNIEEDFKDAFLRMKEKKGNEIDISETLREQFSLSQLDPKSISHLKNQLESFLFALFPEHELEVKEAAKEVTEKIRKKELENVLENLFKEQKRVEKSLLLIDRSQNDLLLEKEKVSSLSESVLLKKLKLAQEENKKLLKEINSAKKSQEGEISQELAKLNSALAHKDLVLQKAKASMRELVSKKEFEIQLLNKKLIEQHEKENFQELDQEMSQLLTQNRNLEAKLEIYKNKVQALSELKNDLSLEKNLKRTKEVSDNALKLEKRKNTNNEEKLAQARETEKKLRTELLTLHKESNENQMLQAKVKELEVQTKKLNQELLKAHSQIAEEKRSSIKMRAENTALKNQIVKLEKELNRIVAEQSTKKSA